MNNLIKWIIFLIFMIQIVIIVLNNKMEMNKVKIKKRKII